MRRRFLLAAVVAGAVLLVPGVWYALRPSPAEPPTIDLNDADPAVAKAIRDAQQEIHKTPRSGKAWGRLGMVLFAHELRAEALIALAEAEQLEPNEPRWPYLQGAILERGDPDGAIPKLRRALELSHDANVRLHLAELLLAQGQLDEAESLFRQTDRPARNTARAELGLAQLARARGDLTASLEHLSRALDEPESHPKAAHALLAEVYGQIPGEEERARSERELVAHMPDDLAWPDVHVREVKTLRVGLQMRLDNASELSRQGLVAQAAELMRDTVRLYPTSDMAWLTLGGVLLAAREYAHAEAAFRQAAHWGPGRFEAHFRLGVALYLQRGRKPRAVIEAAESFRRAIRLAPMVYPAYYRLGLCLEEQDDWMGALTAYRSALRFRPDYTEAHRSLGRLLAVLAARGTVAASAQTLVGCSAALDLAVPLRAEALAHLRDASQLAPHDPLTGQLLDRLGSELAPNRGR